MVLVGTINYHLENIYCGGFELSLVVNSTHDFVIFPSASGLKKCIVEMGE